MHTMKRFTKADVETHSDGYGRGSNPAINVKDYATSYSYVVAVMDRFGCSEATAERALEYSADMQRESFWDDWGSRHTLREYFPPSRYGKLTVYSEGRSGGWLVVHGLPDIEDWDAIAVADWGRFARSVRADVDYRTSLEVAIEDIQANEWAMDADSINRMLEEAAV